MRGNTPAHKAQQSVHVVGQYGFEVLPQPAYSPDLASSDFYLFLILKFYSKDAVSMTTEAVESWLGPISGPFTLKDF